MDELQRMFTERRDKHLMPWRIPTGNDGLTVDSFLVATMDGDQMVSISLHVDRGGVQDTTETRTI